MNKESIIKDIITLFEQDYYYKPIKVDILWKNNYIEK